MFSLSSVMCTHCCFALFHSVEASFSSLAFFAFKHVFTVDVESCSAISADGWHEFESETLRNVATLRFTFGSCSALTSFPDEKERRIFTQLSPLFTVDVLSVSSEFNVRLNASETSAIVLNVPAGSLSRCIMGSVSRQCRVHVTWKDSKLTASSFENAPSSYMC